MTPFARWTIIALSIQTALMGLGISRLCYQLGYEKGKVAFLTTYDTDDVGTCYVPGGCDNDTGRKTPKRHK